MGIPNQTIESLEKSISFCADCEVTHISSYILKIEENTPFYKVQNKLKLADDDTQADTSNMKFLIFLNRVMKADIIPITGDAVNISA